MTTQRILIVDDDPEWHEIIVPLFEEVLKRLDLEESYAIVTALNAKEARRIMKEGVDLATLDINLSANDKDTAEGMKLLDEISKLSPQTCTVMISAMRKGYERKAFRKYGVIDFFDKKVFEPEEFKKIIGETLLYGEALRLLDSERWKDWKRAVEIWEKLFPEGEEGEFTYPRNIKSEFQARLDQTTTNLPAGESIDRQFRHLLPRSDWSILSIAIEHFDEFKEYKGSTQANDVLRRTAMLLDQVVDDFGSPDDFLGYAGGNEFIIITTPQKDTLLRRQIVKSFAQEVGLFYDFRERERGYMLVPPEDPDSGQQRQVSLMSITAGVIRGEDYKFYDIRELSEMASKARRRAKSKV